MTLQGAYVKAKSHSEFKRLNRCFDYGDVWVFYFVPDNYDENDKSTWIYGGDISIDKQSGKLGVFNPADNLDMIGSGVEIPINQVTKPMPPRPTVRAVRTSVSRRREAAFA